MQWIIGAYYLYHSSSNSCLSSSMPKRHRCWSAKELSQVSYCRVDTNSELNSLTLEFNLHFQDNSLSYDDAKETELNQRQIIVHSLIFYMHDSRGMSYRKISKWLNRSGIKTHQGNTWGEADRCYLRGLGFYVLLALSCLGLAGWRAFRGHIEWGWADGHGAVGRHDDEFICVLFYNVGYEWARKAKRLSAVIPDRAKGVCVDGSYRLKRVLTLKRWTHA